jgi:Tol biopolymer transport system component
VRVATLPQDTDTAFWDRGSDRLFVVGYTSVQAWTPSSATLSSVSAANQWSFYPNVSPAGGQVVYTAYSDAIQGTQPRVYLYDLATSKTRMLIDQPRSQVLFVRDGWVWYLEEQPCSDCPNNTQPTDKVFAMNASSGVEQQVVFATGEGLTSATDLLPGEFWPNS